MMRLAASVKVVIDYYPYCAAGAFRMNVGEFRDGIDFVTDGLPCIINDKGEYVFDGSDSVFYLPAPVFDYVEVPYEDYVRVAMKVDEKRCYGAIQLKEK